MAVHHSTFEESMQAALQGPDTQRVARPAGRRQTQQETIMSKLARVLAVGALLTVMSLGSTAHAQDGDAPSLQAGITQSDPSQPQPPGTPEDPGTPTDPGTPVDPGTTPGSTTTTTTHPPVVRPTSLPVTVSPRTGGPGTTVIVRADLRGCQRPDSGHGFFQDADGRDVDGLSIWLVSEHVSGGRRYTGRYRIANNDAAGLGQFGVVCDKSIVGFADFRVQPSRSPVPVRVTPQAAGRGTTVKITAEVGWCQRIHIWFYDSKADGLTMAGGAKPIAPQLPIEAGTVTASYTLTRKDAIGPARFRVVCGIDIDNARVGEASFRVLAPNGGGTGGDDPVNDPNKPTQLPKRVDTGQGGTADGTGHDGLDPMLLLPAAGLVLIALAAGLWLRQTTTRGRL
jgi:hypothetical protein